MTAALHHVAPTDVAERVGLLWDARASASGQTGEANPFAAPSDVAGQKATNASGQSSSASISEAARQLGKRDVLPYGADDRGKIFKFASDMRRGSGTMGRQTQFNASIHRYDLP